MTEQPITEETQPVPESETPDEQPASDVAPAPTPTLIDRITGAATEFAAGVRKMETAKTEHGQTVSALALAQAAVDGAQASVSDAQTAGVEAADRLIAVVNEWRTAAVS